ncbi:benzoate transporter BenE [Salmonella enterica subsp. enterica serovar Kentucky]|nr:benzoate transporter BenE [Salmonella enterica subsp. enterica serovar Kentucky]
MRLLSLPLPTVLSGLVAVLVGYASSAAIIWQAALAAGATPTEIAGWMTALGIAMGISTLTLTLWYRAPVLTAWSTPGAALLVTGLQGLSLPDAVGIFIVANALIVLCGVTGLFARLMRIIPHSLAAAMLAGILLRFGLQAFGTLNGEFVMCGGMLLAWLLFKVFAPRYAVIAAMVMGITVALFQGKVAMSGIHFAPVWPTFVPPHFSFAQSLSVAVPLFLVTMASQNAPGVATMKASGYQLPVSPLMIFTGLLALLLSPFGVYSICIAAITAAICQSPDAHPDPTRRWLAAAAAGVFYLLAGWFGGSITELMVALPVSWVQMLAGLALLSTISGSLYQALTHESERDAAVIAFLVTAIGLTLMGIGSAFWGLIAGGIGYAVLTRTRRPSLSG